MDQEEDEEDESEGRKERRWWMDEVKENSAEEREMENGNKLS